jgi:hypothetical protein
MLPWPPILGLRDSLTTTLKYLRRSRTQAEIAEDYGVSQSTISRAIAAMTPLIVGALIQFVPTADSLSVGQLGLAPADTATGAARLKHLHGALPDQVILKLGEDSSHTRQSAGLSAVRRRFWDPA